MLNKESVHKSKVFTTPLPERAQDLAQEVLHSHQDNRRTASLPPREKYLEALASGNVAPIYLVSGASGSGKSHIVKEMNRIPSHVTPSQRLMTRSRRQCDGTHDIAWEKDRHNHENLVFSYGKYGHQYGFTKEILDRAISGHSSSIIVGDCGKFLAVSEALENLAPLVPIVPLRVDVPLDVAAERMLKSRSESFSGEAQHRNLINRRIALWEASQLEEVKAFAGLHTLINLTESECSRHGYAERQLQPLEGNLLESLVSGFRKENVRHSSVLASDLKRVRQISDLVPGIPPELLDVLTSKLAPAAFERSVPLVLKGGMAVALYTQDIYKNEGDYEPFEEFKKNRVLLRRHQPLKQVGRPVSADIDFALSNIQQAEALSQVFTDIGAHQGELRNFVEKSLFKSLKFSTSVSGDEGNKVELDGIVTSRVKPTEGVFCFSFPYDDVLNFNRRTVRLLNGHDVGLVPPELLIVEKLAAGRGSELGKYDIYDAATLISTQPVRVTLIKRIIEMQRYDLREFDSAAPLALTILSKNILGRDDCTAVGHSVGILDPKLLEIISDRVIANHESGSLTNNQIEIPLHLDLSNLKQFALVDRLLRGIEKVHSLAQSKTDSPSGETLASVLGQEEFGNKLQHLQDFLYHIARFHLGRTDVFINRNG